MMKSTLAKISKDLNLSFYPEDWGIINSSSSRIEEFICYMNDNFDFLDSEAKFSLFELIFASFNDGLVAWSLGKKVEYGFIELIQKYNLDMSLSLVLNYWIRLTDQNEFPIGLWLKEHGFNFRELPPI